jgi:hypothetical protein
MIPVMEIIMPQHSAGNVPAFLAKLWKIVDNPETDLLICWTDEGTSFIIKNQAAFARDLLPYYYKHSNMASFVRQLNMYGFHKVMSVDSGGLKGEREEMEFAHLYFLRGQEHLLSEIKRKVSIGHTKPPPIMPTIRNEKVTEVLGEVSMLKERQEETDAKIESMRQENEALWQEVLNMRQKHTQQQKIVNKLIHFLMAVVQPRMAGMKRRYGVPGIHLAIEDTEGPNAKMPKMDPGSGPVIQDVTNADPLASLLEGVGGVEGVIGHGGLGAAPSVELPLSPRVEEQQTRAQGKYRLVDPQSVSPATAVQGGPRSTVSAVSVSPKRPGLNREISKEDFDLDINNMQAELDNLKDILSGQITLDTSLVSSLFSPEDTLPNLGGNLGNLGNLPNLSNLPANISMSAEGLLNDENELNGDQNMISYNPSLFELTESEDGQGFLDSLNSPSSPHMELNASLNTPQPSSLNSSLDLNTPQISEDATNPLSSYQRLTSLLNLLEEEYMSQI